jgi:hypothetical protein
MDDGYLHISAAGAVAACLHLTIILLACGSTVAMSADIFKVPGNLSLFCMKYHDF